MDQLSCTNCGRKHPSGQLSYKCPTCGSFFDLKPFPAFDPDLVDLEMQGIWRYHKLLGLSPGSENIYLGEGSTPLVPTKTPFGEMHFKLEFLNPTGSFKDRGTAVLASFLKAQGITEAVEDSSGNAGSSFAAYASAAGIRARIFVPDYASGPKRRQIEAYGAEVVRILGPRSETADAVKRAADEGAVYASHAYLPFHLAGYATLAYEIVDQLKGTAPAYIVAPAGQGSLLLGMGRGFENLKTAGIIETVPRIIGVQAMACAPLWAVFTMGMTGLQWVTERDTIAEGIRIRTPIWGDPVLQMVQRSRGMMVAVEEDQIAAGRSALASLGYYVEPTSAVIWDAIRQLSAQDGFSLKDGPVVAILTGSGLKAAG